MLGTFLKGASSGPKTTISYVSEYTFSVTATTGFSLTNISGGTIQAGDFCVVFVGASFTSDLTITGTSSNMTSFNKVLDIYANDTFDANLAVFTGFASTSTAQIGLSGFGGGPTGVGLVAIWFRGVDPTTPLDVTRTTATGTNTIRVDPPAITPVTNGSVVVFGGAGAGAADTFSTTDSLISPLTGLVNASRSATNSVSCGVGASIWPGGAFNPVQFTFNETDSVQYSFTAATLALRPA
jgi:hypothetical protein